MSALRNRAQGALLILVVLSFSACSSSKAPDDRAAEFRALTQAGDYEEIELRIKVLESQGTQGSDLDYWMGLAQLSQDDDRFAAERFDRAVAADSSLAFDVASHYRAAALRDFEDGWEGRAAERMRRAYLLDGITGMGVLGPAVADLLFNDKDYLAVIPLYRQLLRSGGDEQQEQTWFFRMGLALEQSGMREAGLEQYRGYWSRFGRKASNVYQSYVLWRQGVLLLDFAEERMEHGDCLGAMDLLDELIELRAQAEHMSTAYYRKGLCLEDLLRMDEARECYQKVLEIPAGEGGGVHEEARQRIRSMAGAGAR